ncbi:nitrogenase component 1 [Geomonas subterranea]|uniref:nitrogenase component 1 n=1 Tax=Geomonas subterranea TaxID=2847989 RepID=UPI001CD75268|nr:nitrogenase component 1 [Geomonas fuzhouensis]
MSHIERPRYQCALGGALVTINSIDRAVAVVHSAPGCAASADGAATVGGGYWGTTETDGRATPSTNIVEREVIFGGEERLAEQIAATLEVVDADLYAVITGCMTDIIGDDVRSVVSEFQRQGKPVIVAETGGFKGDSTVGADFIWEAIFSQFVAKGLPKDARRVNLFGFVPAQDVFWRGNLLELKRLLGLLGIEANTFLTPQDRLQELKEASRASLNIVFSDVHGVKPAKLFEELHGTPFVTEPLPIGPTATEAFLRRIASLLKIDEETAEFAIAQEKAYYYSFINPMTDLVNDQDFQRFGIVIGNANYSYAVTRFISEDLGWLPYLAAVTDLLHDDQQQAVIERLETLPADYRPKVIFETDTDRITARLQVILEQEEDPYGNPIHPAFVIGSNLDRPLAAGIKAGFWGVSYPITNRIVTDQFYVGFRGGLRLATELISVLVANR